jgi:GAF domain-containing protein
MEPVPAATLELVRGQARGSRWGLGSAPCAIGRVAGNDVCLEGRSVSRQHARILPRDGGFVIEDLGSRFGVYVGDERVRERALVGGDLIRIGEVVLRFTEEARGAAREGAERRGLLLSLLEAVNSTRVLGRVLERVLSAVIEITGAERGFVLLPAGDASGSSRRIAGLEVRLSRNPHETGPLSGDGGISSKVLERALEADALLGVGDATEDESLESDTIASLELRAVVCAPLRGAPEAGRAGALLGALYVDNPRRATAFTPEALETVQALARHAALAIENAQLFESRERQLEQLRRARDHEGEARLGAAGLASRLRGPLEQLDRHLARLEARPGGGAELAGELSRIREAERRLREIVAGLSESETPGS